MLKSELIEKLAEQNPHLYRQDVEDLVNAILDTVADALAQGDRVELRGFGAFTAKPTSWMRSLTAIESVLPNQL